MDVKARIRAIYENSPKTDRELVEEAKEEITIALSKEKTIREIFQAMRECGFKGDRRKFTEILQKLGLWTIRVGHKKPVVNTPRPEETPAKPATAQIPPSEESDSSPNYTIGPNGTKIWGGKKNNNPAPAPATKPVDNNKPNVKYKPGGTTQEDLEKVFGKAAFF